VFRPGEWNDYAVHTRGRDVWVVVNGRETARLKNDPGRLMGRLALQLHGGQDVRMEFRAIEVAVPPEDGRVLPAGETTRDARATELVTLNGYFPFQPPTDARVWSQRREAVRRQVLVAAGLWPLPADRPAVEASVHSRIDRGEYTIEQVVFESRPGFFVTGSLYRPAGESGRRPAVLCPHGHRAQGRHMELDGEDVTEQLVKGWETDPVAAKYYFQARLAQLARMGFVVFQYDMIGYADSVQLDHMDEFDDVASILDGRSHFGMQTWNSLRALDYLAGLPDVDPTRIGVTGASGGGTQTFMLCAIDERPVVALPAVMVSTSMQGGCVCENAPHLRVDTGNVEFAALFAPRPLGLTWADDWTIEMPGKGIPELLTLYDTLDANGRLAWSGDATHEHNYNAHSRAFLYRLFRQHLGLASGVSVDERSFEPVPPAELSVWDEAHPRPGRWDAIAGVGAAHAAYREELLALDADAYRRDVGGALAVLLHAALPGQDEVVADLRYEGWRDGVRTTKALLSRRDSNERIPAVLQVPDNWNGVVCLVVDDDRTGDTLREDVASLLGRGAAALTLDVLLTGEHLEHPGSTPPPMPIDGQRHGDYAGYTWGYNRSLLAHRVQDLLTAMAWARDLHGAERVNLYGNGTAGGWVILARALAGDAVERTAAEWSWSFDRIEQMDDPNLLPGALRFGGLPAFAGLVAPAPLWLVDAEEIPAVTRARYAIAGAADAVRLAPRDELLDWLSR